MIQTGEELGQRQDDILAEIEKKRTMADAMEAKNRESFDSDDSVKAELAMHMKEREEISGKHKGFLKSGNSFRIGAACWIKRFSVWSI